MVDEIKKGETEFDLRSSRLQTLGFLIERKTLIYLNSVNDPTRENVESYYSVLKTLYRNIRHYATSDESESIDEINDLIQRLDSKIYDDGVVSGRDVLTDTRDLFQDCESLEEKIDDLRMEVGLDIPRKSNPDPEDAGLAGLN